jgi:hypothetical protein
MQPPKIVSLIHCSPANQAMIQAYMHMELADQAGNWRVAEPGELIDIVVGDVQHLEAAAIDARRSDAILAIWGWHKKLPGSSLKLPELAVDCKSIVNGQSELLRWGVWWPVHEPEHMLDVVS